MFGRLFESADARRDREARQALDAARARYEKTKRSFRANAAVNLTLLDPNCSFLMNDFSDEFLVFAPGSDRMLKGRFIDLYLVKPEFVMDHESTAKRLAALQAYQLATATSEIRPFFQGSEGGDQWLKYKTGAEADAIRTNGYHIETERAVNAIYYVAMRRNDELLLQVNSFFPKPYLYFANNVARALTKFPTSVKAMNAKLTIEVVAHRGAYRYDQIYDDFHRLNGPKEFGFRSMLEMCVEFLTLVENRTHDPHPEVDLVDHELRKIHMDYVRDCIEDFGFTPPPFDRE